MPQRSFEQQLEDIDAQIARARARRQALMARHGKEERKARDHALFVAGGLVMQCYDGGWQSVDWDALASVIKSNREIFASKTAAKLPTPEATKRLRAWERSQREKKEAGDADDDR